MTAAELREKYLAFFADKGHAVIPSAPLVPENDPTVLFTTAGMHPLVPYLMGEKHPQGTRLANSQKCVRTGDIDDVGDNRHCTFFEMLGNWSLGDYFKKETIAWSWEFLTDPQWLGLDPQRLYVTVFAGDEHAATDEESIALWQEQFTAAGITAGVCAKDATAQDGDRIFLLGAADNWWGPAGATGPCGPCTEMFYDTRPDDGTIAGKTHEQWVDNFRLIEIWNDVFMEFHKTADGRFEKMAQQNVDTGMGLERAIAVLSGKDTVFETDLFTPIIAQIESRAQKRYGDGGDIAQAMRIIADHIKTSVFLVADGVTPSNTERGYVVRRLIRRAVRQGHILGIEDHFTVDIATVVQEMYGAVYPEVTASAVLTELQKEEEKFRKTLESGMREFMKHDNVTGKVAFDLYQTYGFPIELTCELAREKGITVDKDEFYAELAKHQELSRTASAGMFKGGLADNKEETMRLHTAAHLMLAGLRKVLGDHVHQKGSNINGERVRFDFSHPEKLTEEQKRAVEDYVNAAIAAKIPVVMKEMTLEEARAAGAEGVFEKKYSDVVKMYCVEGFSNEICGGPHVGNTGDIGGVFAITKEESSSAGVRRIKAVIR